MKSLFFYNVSLMKKILISLVLIFSSIFLFADTFNEKLTADERTKLDKGELIIRNINFDKNICLNSELFPLSDYLLSVIDKLRPKYLAEVIQYKPYKGNEDLPDRLEDMLNNVPDYAGIPYYSVRAEEWYDLYDSATIVSRVQDGNRTEIKADLEMSPFGTVKETMEIYRDAEVICYVAENDNLLRYYDKFDCVYPHKMKICILLFRDVDKWILYGIGGVNAPRIPFFTERIQTSFINRINTFCSYVFAKF